MIAAGLSLCFFSTTYSAELYENPTVLCSRDLFFLVGIMDFLLGITDFLLGITDFLLGITDFLPGITDFLDFLRLDWKFLGIFFSKTSKRPWGPHLSLVGSKWVPRPSPGPGLSCRPVPLGTRVRQPPSREAFPHLSGLSGLEFSPNFLVTTDLQACNSTSVPIC